MPALSAIPSLVAHFLAHARDEELRGWPLAALGARLQELLEAGRAAWPGLRIGEEEIVAYVAERADAKGKTPDDPLVAYPADLYLACACALGDRAALTTFERKFLGLLPGYLAGYGDAATIADIAQELRAKLLSGDGDAPPRILAYRGQGRLEGWLRVAAVRAGLDAVRRRKARSAAPDAASSTVEPDGLASVSDPELALIKDRYRADFDAAFREAVTTLSASERELLRFYLIDRLTVAEIGSWLRTSKATAARRVAQCRTKLLETTRARLSERLRLTDSEAESITRLLWTGLDASVAEILASRAVP
jgi:RNA polymerase sigma-70 factor (ECF subfamily)